MRALRAILPRWPIASVMGGCWPWERGGYDRSNLARAWSGVVEGLLDA